MPTNLSKKQWKIVVGILIAAIASRIACCSGLELSADEAFYWLWSQHLAAGYFENGPLIAFMAAPLNSLPNEMAYRLTFIIVGALPVVFSALIAGELTDEPSAPICAATLCAVAPMLVVMCGLAITDAPHLAAYSAATWLVLRAQGKTWLLAGTIWGLAMLAKWSSVLMIPGVILSVVRDKNSRSQLKTPWPYLGVLIGLLLFSPFLIWNWQHDWVSFKCQFMHASAKSHGGGLLSLLKYLVSHLTSAGPIAAMILVAPFIEKPRPGHSSAWDRLVFMTLFPVLVLSCVACVGKVEYNWTEMVYPGCLSAAAALLASRGRFAHIAMAVSAIISISIVIFLELETRTPRLLANNSVILERMHGARAEAAVLSEYKDKYVITSNHQIASRLSYYGGFRRFGPTFDRASQFCIWNEKPRPDDKECVIISYRKLTPDEVTRFYATPEIKIIDVHFANRVIRKLWVYKTKGAPDLEPELTMHH